MASAVSRLCVVLIIQFLLNVKGSYANEDNGDGCSSTVQPILKLHTEPADWQTARITCHFEDSIMAAPWSDRVWSSILSQVLNTSIPTIYAGVQEHFPDGLYKSKDDKQVLSRDVEDTLPLARCVVYHINGSRELVDCKQRFPYVCYRQIITTKSACGDGYELSDKTGSCYKFHANCKSWPDAYDTCKEEGGHLVIVNSDAEADVLTDMFARYPFEALNGTHPLWGVMAVGFYYWRETDTYITIEGQSIEEAGYAKWSYGNPSSRGKSKELAGGMFRSGLLDDVDKTYKVPFICEKKPLRDGASCCLSNHVF